MKKIVLLCFAMISASMLFSFELSNPGFENSDAWWGGQATEPAVANFDYEYSSARTGTKACHVEVTAVSDQNWHAQLNVPSNWTATSGNTYTLSFYAKADVATTIHIAAQDGAPSYAYRSGADGALKADDDWKLFTYEYTADKDGEGAVHFNIYVGNAIGNYYFDDFSLTETVVTELPDFAAPPAEGAFSSGVYRNLFAEAGKDESAIDAKLSAVFEQLFYGDNDAERVYYQIEEDLAYILDVNSGDIRSEGMSYGMMICVQMNKKFEFDCLWNFAKQYMQHKEEPRKGYFSWSVDPASREMNDPNSASDGEEYFATALYFASHRWGDGEGIYDYSAEANQLLHDMLHLEERNGGQIDGLTNIFNAEEKKVVFVPQASVAEFSDPSYHLPAFYKLWAEWAEEDNQFWSDVADTSAVYLQKAMHPNTGLTTDYMTFDAKPVEVSFYSNSKYFSSDSYRVAMNVAMDCSWWGYQDWHSEKLDSLLLFLSGMGSSYNSQYEQDGTPLESTWESGGFYAMNGVAPLGATVNESWDFINKLWGMSVPAGQYRYYDGMLYMLAMLNASGEYKIWKPGDTLNTEKPVAPEEIEIYDPFAGNQTTGFNSKFSETVPVSAFFTENTNSLTIVADLELQAVTLYNASAKSVFEIGSVENGTHSYLLPALQHGVYFVKIEVDERIYVIKALK